MSELIDRMQRWLDDRADSYFAGNFDDIAGLTVLPYVIVTRTAVLIIENEARLKEGFDAWVSMLRTQHVSHVIQKVEDVNPIGEGLISARYVTHLLRGATPICPPYSSTSIYRAFDDGTLRAVSTTTGMKNLSWPITVPRVDDDGDPLE